MLRLGRGKYQGRRQSRSSNHGGGGDGSVLLENIQSR